MGPGMKCPACGAENIAPTGCYVCGAIPTTAGARVAGQGVSAGQSRRQPGPDWRAAGDPPVRTGPVDPASGGRFVGVARAIRLRTEPSATKGPMWQVLSFRLDRFSEDGRPLPSIPVEVRRLHLHGSVSEGETVEVRGNWHPGELLEVKRIRNISAGGTVYGTGKAHPVLRVLGAILVLAIIAGIGALIIELASHSQQEMSNGAAVPFLLVTR
jgi:hypothetical protein